MRIVTQKPWWWNRLQKSFPKMEWGKVAFTWGHTIYTHDPNLSEHFIAHETVHMHQQKNAIIGLFHIYRYFKNPRYRLHCEVEAYKAQYRFILESYPDKEKQQNALTNFAKALSGPVYGNIISFTEARNLLCE